MASDISIQIPEDLLPADGRFGSGPTRVPQRALERLAEAGPSYMGTSHRRDLVRRVVGRVREGMAELFGLPDGYEVVVGNGGASAFWGMAAFSLIERASQHLSFGVFSSKFARAVEGAPHLDPPEVIESEAGTHPLPRPSDRIDLYALTHNETSTGVTMPVDRVEGAAVTLVDATSAAGGMLIDPDRYDIYYFSPQKAFGADGGMFAALCSPKSIERMERVAASGRWIPPFFSMAKAVYNSRKNQTYNTPALATLHLLADNVEWMLEQGGLAWASDHCAANAEALYGWAEAHALAAPFVTDPAMRSQVSGTINFDERVAADRVAAVLRSNGVVDTESYPSLGENQLRIGLWPTVPRSDIEALLGCIDYVIEGILD